MKSSVPRLSWAIVALFVVSGCAMNAVHRGDTAIRQGDYLLAKSHFERVLQKDSANFAAQRGLGRVYYHLKEYDSAAVHLENAQHARPDDGLTLLYLGLVKEAQNDFSGAGTIYASYPGRDRKAKISRQIMGRLLYVRNQGARQQVEQALKFESKLVRDTSAAATIGVLPFITAAECPDSLQPLAAGLAALISNDLQQVHSLKLVERAQLKYILDELALAKTSAVDKRSAPRVGRLLGASYLIRGDLELSLPQRVGVHSGIVHTADSVYKAAIVSEESLSKIWEIQKQITFAVLDSLGIVLTPQEQQAIARIPTENFQALLLYSRGIEELDGGDPEQAQDYFNQANVLDPGFAQASSLQEEASLLIEGGGTLSEFESSVIEGVLPEFESGFAPLDDVFDLTEPAPDPRTDDTPPGNGTVSVSGTIR